MKLSVSILGINDEKKINELNNDLVDYIHLDVMDGKFVKNINLPKNNINYNKKLDVHLMTNIVDKYLNYYKKLNIEYLTFHYEIGNVLENIALIKKNNIKVGLAVNPETKMEKIIPFLDKIDLLLIMSVNPGMGGQTFLDETYEKIDKINEYKINNNCNFLIEVDGGINNQNIKKLDIDIAVVGSYITNSDNYQKQIEKMVIK